ncbi:MAG: hypothetical protein Q7K34_01395 [archaeon]|nr:hypothetical protein [archaeon]
MNDVAGIVEAIDKTRVARYFKRQGIKFDPRNPKSVPQKRIMGLEDLFAEFSERASEWEDASIKFPILKGEHIVLNAREMPIVNVAQEIERYDKSPKPAICRAILEGLKVPIGHELQQLLRVARMLQTAEKQPRYKKVQRELHFTREIFEQRMLEAVKWRSGDQDWVNFWHNVLQVTRVIHAKLR